MWLSCQADIGCQDIFYPAGRMLFVQSATLDDGLLDRITEMIAEESILR